MDNLINRIRNLPDTSILFIVCVEKNMRKTIHNFFEQFYPDIQKFSCHIYKFPSKDGFIFYDCWECGIKIKVKQMDGVDLFGDIVYTGFCKCCGEVSISYSTVREDLANNCYSYYRCAGHNVIAFGSALSNIRSKRKHTKTRISEEDQRECISFLGKSIIYRIDDPELSKIIKIEKLEEKLKI